MSEEAPTKRAHVRTGRKPPGRPKGTPNKVTAEAREAFRLMLERLAPKVEAWIEATALEDPARAADLLLRVSERFIPVLSRQEVAVSGRVSLEDLVPKRQPTPSTDGAT